MSAAAMLHYSHNALEDLRLFCGSSGIHFTGGGMLLPLVENRDQFVVRAADYGID